MQQRFCQVVLLGAIVLALLAIAGCANNQQQGAQQPPAALEARLPAPEGTPQAASSPTGAQLPPIGPTEQDAASRVPTAPTTQAPQRQLLQAALAPTPSSNAFNEVVARARPAVVGLAVRAQVIDPFFRLAPAVQTGTGVIIDSRGYILTNAHVLENGTQIEVTTDDERTFKGVEVVGRDVATDLAVIKVSAPEPLPTLSFAEPDSYHVGDWVVAIGNALALPGGPTVTVGVIGALERSICVERRTRSILCIDGQLMSDLVQTDATINEGNSGGPLLNLRGEVIGINTIVAQAGSAQGIGFAVSSFTAAPVARVLMEEGRVPWAWLGLSVDELSPSSAMELNLTVRKGVIAVQISRGGPAHLAGIQPGDVLLRLDDIELRRVRDLDTLLRVRYKAGDTATLRFQRGGQESSVKVTFTQAPRR